MWKEFFQLIRRTNTTPEGDVDRRIIPEQCGFEWHRRDTCLGDNGGLDHDWLEACPASVKSNPTKKVPLILFSHGMSDNPLKAADMIKLHEVGEREGFITVYPFSSDRYKWNLSLNPELYSDVDYYLALIRYLKKKYPIDETRIYMSGFSNGAGMAMIFSLTHPELVAAASPVDSTFPYASMGHFRAGGWPVPYITRVLAPGDEPPRMVLPKEDPNHNLAPLRAALKRQEEKRYTLPIMYFYGTREGEYPIKSGSNQEHSYNFWKEFNNIETAPTQDDLTPDSVGVPGQKVVELYPCPEHPEHRYTQHIFYTRESVPKDYYNFMLMHGKAHEVHPAEREFCWSFLSRFSRGADGSLSDTKYE
jgi:poly(3-hydroxybutyrate) depolymerase